ncbi:hypothetical protein Gotri_025367, partial [Gossypium trilobum]|nr:hypothetical protein [Gossypium trilobum]
DNVVTQFLCLLYNGGIIAWRASCETDSFQLAASLEGHNGAVSCLAVGDKMLFSGSLDKTIRVCSSASLVCGTLTHFNALRLHADVVTSLVHCNGYLFSSSVDCTIKVWFATEGQNWSIILLYFILMCEKCLLFCGFKRSSLHGIFSKREVRVIERGPKNLFFTGDASGSLTVWKWRQNSQESS